jgi:hypothetical protein
MRRVLVYNKESQRFEFLEVKKVVSARMVGPNPFICYGTFDYPEGTSLQTFSASQMVDALQWASRNGRRV